MIPLTTPTSVPIIVPLSKPLNVKGYVNKYRGMPVTPMLLVRLMFDLYAQKGILSQATRPQGTYLREAKSFIEDYGAEVAVELMMDAANHCKHPWGISKYLRRLAEQRCIKKIIREPAPNTSELNFLKTLQQHTS